MSRHAKRRDACERIIIDALIAIGASVQQLDLTNGPDLLVGHRGNNYLLECKSVAGKPGIGMKKTASGLKQGQEAWMLKWRGMRPVVVTTVDEALRAIGART